MSSFPCNLRKLQVSRKRNRACMTAAHTTSIDRITVCIWVASHCSAFRVPQSVTSPTHSWASYTTIWSQFLFGHPTFVELLD